MARPPIEQLEDTGEKLKDSYLEYPHRSYGMDHNRYDWSIINDRKQVIWPGNKKIALWINIALEFFPLDMPSKPFKALGGTVTSYPDLRHYTLRDYGNRVGFFRVVEALKKSKIENVSIGLNAMVADRYPYLVDYINNRNWEIISYGLDMSSIHYSGLEEEKEREYIEKSLKIIKKYSKNNITGWWSPARSESWNTPDLLSEYGIKYFCDWINDDMPYKFKTKTGPLIAMPHQHWIDDSMCYLHYKHREQDFVDQAKDHFDYLCKEANNYGGRIMALTIHPWASGQPHRISALEEIFDYVSNKSIVWNATGNEILQSWNSQQ